MNEQPEVAGTRLPGKLAASVRQRWPARGAQWTQVVEGELGDLCAAYRAEPVRVLAGRFSYVVLARTADGRDLVFRSTADPAGPYEAAAAKLLSELGVGPHVYETMVGDASTWTVMEAVQPGTAVAGVTATEGAGVLRPLVEQAPVVAGLPPLAGWLRARLQKVPESDLAPGTTSAPREERMHALGLLDELEHGTGGALCHGDAHPGNILRGHDRLVLIDPRGVAGEPAYDAAVLALKCGHEPGVLARLLELDAERVEAWHAVAAAARV